jgi:hypothetical protein
MLPRKAARMRLATSTWISRLPTAAMAPATKRRESPGRIGVTTSPVSQKMIAKRIA